MTTTSYTEGESNRLRGHQSRVSQPTVKGRHLALLSIALLIPACNGGTVDQHALTNDAAAIDSLACEGALLAHQVVDGATTEPFTRVHAGELATRASNFEDALSQRPTDPGIEQAVRKEAERAGRVADLLHQLEANDPDSAADLKGRLEQEGDCA
jgi:hypothetical protein